jgi:two-component system, sensor histidine kinase
MASLERLIEHRAPVAPTATAAEIAARFEADSQALLIAVVDDEHRPLGLISRERGLSTASAGTLTASDMMDPRPLLVDAGTRASLFRDQILASDPSALARGFIATEHGAYAGVGSALTLLIGRGQASQSRSHGATLTQALADDVVRQLEGAQTLIDALLRHTLPADSKSCCQALGDSFSDIHRLMRRAANMHAAENGLEELSTQPTLLRDVMDGVEARWTSRTAGSNVTLLTAYDGAPDLVADIDAQRLADLFDGLVERALSETGRGAVEVTLSARPALEGLALEARVRDAGGPIAPARLARIFDPLASGASLSVGLGMAHAASLAAAMHGTLRAEVNAGTGATIIFEMIAPEAAPEILAETASDMATAHILIVDDNATNRMVAEALCEMFDCTSEQVVDGVEAVEAASQRRFDLILMDIKMPRMDGVAATRAIRALPGDAGAVPIVALTANADPSDVRGYIEAGMNDCVEKPIKAERLLNVLDKVLNGAEIAQDSAAA